MIAIKKGVKMPVDCSVCFGRGAIWCRFDESDRIVVPALPDESFEGKPEWCPLVDVPDADAGGSCSEIPNGSDSVSRRAAIDAFMEILDRPNHAEFLYTDEVCRVLESLPSVQPEIIRCKDCRYYEWMSNRMSDEQLWFCHNWYVETGKDDYCSYAERREV